MKKRKDMGREKKGIPERDYVVKQGNTALQLISLGCSCEQHSGWTFQGLLNLRHACSLWSRDQTSVCLLSPPQEPVARQEGELWSLLCNLHSHMHPRPLTQRICLLGCFKAHTKFLGDAKMKPAKPLLKSCQQHAHVSADLHHAASLALRLRGAGAKDSVSDEFCQLVCAATAFEWIMMQYQTAMWHHRPAVSGKTLDITKRIKSEWKKALAYLKRRMVLLLLEKETKKKKRKKKLIAQVCTYYKAVIYRNEAKINSLATSDIV